MTGKYLVISLLSDVCNDLKNVLLEGSDVAATRVDDGIIAGVAAEADGLLMFAFVAVTSVLLPTIPAAQRDAFDESSIWSGSVEHKDMADGDGSIGN